MSDKKEQKMPLTLMGTILLYLMAGFTALYSLLSSGKFDPISISMLPVAVLLIFHSNIGVLGTKLLGIFFSIIWMILIMGGMFAQNGFAKATLLGYSSYIPLPIFHIIFVCFCSIQLYTAFVSAPKYYTASNT